VQKQIEFRKSKGIAYQTLGTTRAQTLFLRDFRISPTGPAPEHWPSPSVFRRWMRKPRFRSALASLRDNLRFQADIHLATAANSAAHALSQFPAVLNEEKLDHCRAQIEKSIAILKLSHLRQRFPIPEPEPDTYTARQFFKQLRMMNKTMPLGEVLDFIQEQSPHFQDDPSNQDKEE
jgi:hypothetical protein